MPNACANDIENKVIGIMMAFTGRIATSDMADFHPGAKLGDDLGLDSLDVAEIELELECVLGIEFPPDSPDELETVGDLIAEVKKLMGRT